MAEKIRFPSPEEREERKIAERLEEEGGIFYREEIDPETKELRRYVNILGVEVETYASKEDIEAIKKEIVLSEVDQDLLRTIAECYKLRQPLMLEGDPGVGKTFLLKKFVQLIHGKEAPILELVGTPRTSELEILGHWAPKGLKETELEEYRVILKDFMESEEMRYLSDELNKRLAQLNQEFIDNKITQEEFQDRFGNLITQYINTCRTKIIEAVQLAKFFTPDSEWEFKEGALLQAYSGRGGKGYILIVDEFNLIPSNYQQIFLQIGGEKGALSESISFWGNTGKTRYQRGKDTWICFVSNFPEKTPGRSEVVAPMTDRLVWKVITEEQAENKKAAIRRTAGGRLTKRQKELAQLKPEITFVPVKKGLEWDKVLDEQLGEIIADVVDLLDREFTQAYRELGEHFGKGERRRIQQFEFSGRNPLRVYSYLDHFQVRNPKTGRVDFVATLRNAYKRYYLDRLIDENLRKRMAENFDRILGLSISKDNLKALKESEKDLKSGGKSLPPGVVFFEGEIRTVAEVLDILVERASISEEEKAKLKAEEEERKRRESKIRRNDLDDDIENKIIRDQDIPEEVRQAFRE